MNKIIDPVEIKEQIKKNKVNIGQKKGGFNKKTEIREKKKVTEVTETAQSGKIQTYKRTIDKLKDNVLSSKRLKNGMLIDISKVTKTPQSKELLKKILIKNGINEKSIATTMKSLAKDQDWKARAAYVDRAVKYLGYEEMGQNGQQNMQNNIVIMPSSIIDKYKSKGEFEENELIDAEIE